MNHTPHTDDTAETSAVPATQITGETAAKLTPEAPVTEMRLGFSRGIAPTKWANRWAVAVPEVPLTLVPLTVNGKVPQAEADVDVMLVRVAPGTAPAGSEVAIKLSGGSEQPTIHAMHLYTESIALVVSADDDLADLPAVDTETLALANLLDHPDHAAEWPTPQPWADPSYAPKNLTAALELVATGLGGILMPLPLARHLTRKRTHAVLPLTVEPALPGTEVWATWTTERDAGDVQELLGIMRGRTARSQREGVHAPEPTAKEREKSAKKIRHDQIKAQQKKQAQKIAKLPKNSRGAQLAASKEKRDNAKRLKQAQKRKKR